MVSLLSNHYLGEEGQQPQCFSSSWFCNNANGSPSVMSMPPQHQNHLRKLMKDRSEMKETEEFLAAELNKLSVEERSKALDDVHCVGEDLKETPEVVEQSLREFDFILQTSSNRIYALALQQNRAYVQDPAFRLKFLRANMHNVTKAVQQMMSFLEQKALFFGEDKVAHHILPSDMSLEDVDLLKSGIFQVLKQRDPSGRLILYRGRIPADCNIETMCRVLYHIFFNVVDSIPSVETKGIVLVYYDDAAGDVVPQRPGLNFRIPLHRFFWNLPIRISSVHVCMHSSPGNLNVHNQLLHFTLKLASESIRARVRMHYGSHMERQYQLQTFGIPLNVFPVDEHGNSRAETKSWCDAYLSGLPTAVPTAPSAAPNRVSNDSNSSAANHNPLHHHQDQIAAIDGILETDVLFGRGRLAQYHPGNVRYREFLNQHVAEYNGMHRFARRDACIQYTQELLTNGMRFMKQPKDSEVWVVCDFNEAVDKVAQFYRTRRRRLKQS